MLQDSMALSGYSVDNLAAAKTFYGQQLGLSVNEQPEGLSLELKGGTKVFLYPKSDHTPATFTVLNFMVDDIDAAVEQLTASGLSFEHYDSEYLKTDAKGIARGKAAGQGPDIAWFKDPAGNIISVLSN